MLCCTTSAPGGCRFSRARALLTVVSSLASQPTARTACQAAGLTDTDLPAYRSALATLAAGQMILPKDASMTVAAGIAGPGVPLRARRANLPDLGTHLRLQPVLRALPVQLGSA